MSQSRPTIVTECGIQHTDPKTRDELAYAVQLGFMSYSYHYKHIPSGQVGCKSVMTRTYNQFLELLVRWNQQNDDWKYWE